MNSAALKQIKQIMNLEETPTAVQGRIFGSKGMWALHPTDELEVPRIWIRKSQQKIKLSESMEWEELDKLNRAHFIFNLVSTSRISMPSHLSKHTIINLHHNGVPPEVFRKLVKASIDQELAPLMHLEGPHAMELLRHGVDKAANVSLQRIQHYAAVAQRAYGLASRWDDENAGDVDGAEDDASALPTSSSSRYFAGGKPGSAGEFAVRALDAGFTLEESAVFSEVKQVQKDVVNTICTKLRLLMPCSGEAPMICGAFHSLHG